MKLNPLLKKGSKTRYKFGTIFEKWYHLRNFEIKPPEIEPPIENKGQKPQTNFRKGVRIRNRNGTIWKILILNPLKLNPLLKKGLKTTNKFGTIWKKWYHLRNSEIKPPEIEPPIEKGVKNPKQIWYRFQKMVPFEKFWNLTPCN